jgi:hypothetical protein
MISESKALVVFHAFDGSEKVRVSEVVVDNYNDIRFKLWSGTFSKDYIIEHFFLFDSDEAPVIPLHAAHNRFVIYRIYPILKF